MLDKIKALCKEKKTSISKLEKQLGFGNGVIGRWDKSVPSYERLAAVANALDVPVAYLTGEADDLSAGIKKDPEQEFGDVSSLSAAKKDAWEWLLEHDDETIRRFIKSAMITLGEDE